MLRLPNRRSLNSAGYVEFVILLILVVLIGWVLVQRQSIGDWFKLLGYTPPAAVVQLANQDTMTSYTRHLFYLNKPQLPTTVATFRQDCPENENTIVLGCYHPVQNGIFIYNVPDPALAGVTQVTAAHEVLHAVYARLTSQQRTTLDNELESFYKNGLTDQRVIAEVKLYQQTEPTAVMDEMSCTFGTEVANLPADLQAYYSKYFTNRSAIVAYEQQYQGEFTSRQTTISADDQQLASMKIQIDNQEAVLNSQLSQLNSEQANLNSLKSSNQLDAYNAAIPGYNSDVNAYNAGIANLQAAISAYNQLVDARNKIAADLTTLDKALDTRLTTQSTR